MFNSAESFTADFANSAPSLQPQRQELDPTVIWRVLDEIDYGLILVSPDGLLQRANHLGRYELAQAKFVRTPTPAYSNTSYAATHQLQANNAAATSDLLSGIRAASRGRRQMLTLRDGTESLTLACVPLAQPFEGACSSVLLMLARKNETVNLALSFFARSHKLTSAEEGVLRALCRGQQITDIALSQGVAESTIRSHTRALREKTQCNNIRLMVQQVAALPPVVPLSLAVQTMNK